MVSPAWAPVGAIAVGDDTSCDPGLKLGLEQADKAMVPAATPAKTAALLNDARN
jgi:hypothetical protein